MQIENRLKELQTIDFELPEVLSVLFDLKDVTMIEGRSEKEKKEITMWAKKNRLFHKSLSINKSNYIFISKNKRLMDKSINYFLRLIKRVNDFEAVKQFGLLMNYPKCCIDFYIGLLKREIPQYKYVIYSFINSKNGLDYLLNNLSNRRITNHMVCDYKCKESLQIAKKKLNIVKNNELNLFKEIIVELKYPFLVWNEHQFVQFKGHIDKNNVCCNDIWFKSKVDGFSKKNCPFDENTLKKFSDGDNVNVTDQKIEIYKKNRVVHCIYKNNKYDGVLFKYE